MEKLKRIRCPKCGKLFFDAEHVNNLRIKCPKCGKKYYVTLEEKRIFMEETEEEF